MILLTGGLGFIGSHTVRALLDRGHDCVLVQRRAAVVPDAFAEAGNRVVVAQVDIGDLGELEALGTRYPITGIVHLAGSVPWPPGAEQPIDGARTALSGLLNVMAVAQRWQVARVGVASTIGVYAGAVSPNPLREDLPLPLTAGHPIPAFKKIGELLGQYVAESTGVEVINYRLGAIWGPLGRPASTFFATPQLVHAAAHGTTPELSQLHPNGYTDDGIDMCYVKDCGRAIALLQTADLLRHRTYNVASGRVTTNAEVITALRSIVPQTGQLPAGRDPAGPAQDSCLDISRLQQDTDYTPAYNLEQAIGDYVSWLRAGHAR